jgi:TonB-dependent Receptor Plug Domain.
MMMRLHCPILIVVLLAQPAGAQAADSAHRIARGTVNGVVHDSIARAPLAGALVELVGVDDPGLFARTAVSDSLGRFTLTDVPAGHHKIGFFHPLLDSLGVDGPLREVYVADAQPVNVDLATPSAARLRAAICGIRSADSGSVVVGTVREAADASPVTGATVTAQWVEVSIRRGGAVHRDVRLRKATTTENGWFALCNVPSAGTLALAAVRGADSTDIIEVQAPVRGLLRHELYLGKTHSSGEYVSGVVVAAADGSPMENALVSIAGGAQTHTNERGEWTLLNAPSGTRMVEIHALGYYPERRRVDVVAGAPKVRVALSTLEAVLDTVKIRASIDHDPSGFETRRHSSVGHFLTPADIKRWNPVALSDIFRVVPGVRIEPSPNGYDKRILIRGAFGQCDPAIYLNGQPLTSIGYSTITLTAGDLDTWVRPHDITGIEIYTGDSAPVQYQQGMSGCGSILIWTKLAR